MYRLGNSWSYLSFLQGDPVSSIWCPRLLPQSLANSGACRLPRGGRRSSTHTGTADRRRVRAAGGLWEGQLWAHLRRCLPAGLSLQERAGGGHVCLFEQRWTWPFRQTPAMLVDTPQVTVCQATLLGSEHISPRRRDPRTPSQAATVGGRMGEKNNRRELPQIR